MAALDEGRVERDHVEEGAEAELLLDQAPDRPALGPEQLRVEEQLARVVTRLAVDVDRAGEVGGQPIVEPEGIGEPGVRLGQDDELPGAGMVEPDFAPLLAGQNACDARLRREERRARGRDRSTSRERRRGRAGGRRRRRPGWLNVSSVSPNGPGRTCSRPARRSTRLSRTGRVTSQWPYSLTTQTRAPTASGPVEQRGTGGVELADEPGMSQPEGPKRWGS